MVRFNNIGNVLYRSLELKFQFNGVMQVIPIYACKISPVQLSSRQFCWDWGYVLYAAIGNAVCYYDCYVSKRSKFRVVGNQQKKKKQIRSEKIVESHAVTCSNLCVAFQVRKNCLSKFNFSRSEC